MDESPDSTITMGVSSKGEKQHKVLDLDTNDDDEDDLCVDSTTIYGLGQEFLKDFRRKAAMSFFNDHGLVSHQLNSYNDFIQNGIQKVFDAFEDLQIEPGYDPSRKGDGEWQHATLKFGKVTLDKPMFWAGENFVEKDREYVKMYPWVARLQKMTYSARMKVNVTFQVYTQNLVRSDKFKTGKEQYIDKQVVREDTKDVIVGRLPVMVKSVLCWMKDAEKEDCDFDHGGYFVIKGAEKKFIAQEQISMSRFWISGDPKWSIQYKSEVKKRRVFVKLRDTSEGANIRTEKVISVYMLSSIEVPLWILFFALGVSSDKEAVELIDNNVDDVKISDILIGSIYDADEKCEGFRKKGAALRHVRELLKNCKFPPGESLEECFSNQLFPSLDGLKQKARFLAYMVKCLLQAYTGRRKCDNKDDFRNKRLGLAGELLGRELRIQINNLRKNMMRLIQRDLYPDRDMQDIDHYVDASVMTNGLSRAFSTGAWSHPSIVKRISGVVATLRRTNPLQATADMRKMRQQVQYAGKVGDARYPHPSHWGRICFLTTPDGENCGLVKNLAVTGLVSTSISEPLVDKLFDSGMEKLVDDTSTCLHKKDKVFLNGDWVGVCENSMSFAKELRSKRRRRELPSQVEIKRDDHHGEVRIFSDAGRILRPLLVVENLKKAKLFKGGNYTFQTLMDRGIVELIGVEEEEDCCTAWDVNYLFEDAQGKGALKYTHCELDMSFLLGLSCGIMPFANHDNARRILYQTEKFSQQAIGFCTTNPNIRVDTVSHQLYYPQRPLFRTMLADCLGKPGHPGVHPRDEFFNGQNAIVAVNVHLGYNQEDSLVMNRASLERGLFRTEHIRSYKAEIDNMESDKKMKPEDCLNFGRIESKIGRVDSLDDDGFPFIGANLQSGDIVIGRCTESGADHSIKLKHSERGMVQKVVLSANDEGKNFAVVSLRQVRSPCLGDKFTSMHGQKGVIGFLEAQENFPFTKQGIVPDIVINPHGFPSRQTPGQILEAALGKGIAWSGERKYATPFSTPSFEAITEQLHKAGFSRSGSERVYNGRTGEMLRTLIFTGPTFYQRLVHMAEDKVKFRNTGPVHPLTRQPVADRKRFGGVKFGEMERDCLIAHGAAANLHERLFTLSDSAQMHVCQKCRNVAAVIQRATPGGRRIRGPYCRVCESLDDIVKVNVPYGAKLLSQELFSMGISLKFETKLC